MNRCHALVSVVASCVMSVAAFGMDITDQLPNGKIFEMYDPGVEMTWAASTEVLTVEYTFVSGGTPTTITLNTNTGVDRIGRLSFSATPGSGSGANILSIVGTIDIRPDGDYYAEYDITYTNGDTRGRAGWSNHNLITYKSEGCDCDDNLDFGCVTNDCNTPNTACSPTNTDSFCVWTVM